MALAVPAVSFDRLDISSMYSLGLSVHPSESTCFVGYSKWRCKKERFLCFSCFWEICTCGKMDAISIEAVFLDGKLEPWVIILVFTYVHFTLVNMLEHLVGVRYCYFVLEDATNFPLQLLFNILHFGSIL